jgi:hypothetical protein
MFGRSCLGRNMPTRIQDLNDSFQYERDIPRIPANVLVAATVAVYTLEPILTLSASFRHSPIVGERQVHTEADVQA